jgi:hypothetical protein
MTDSPARQIAARVREQHELVLKCARDLDDAQLAAPPGAHAPAIRFHLWHIARWADIVGAHLPTMGRATAADARHEIWATEALVDRWGLAEYDLGYRETGMSLPDAAALALPLPAAPALLAYAERAFAAAEAAIAAVDDERFVAPGQDPLGRAITVGGAILNHLLHVGRHLGMIEALRGVLGLHGTATR